MSILGVSVPGPVRRIVEKLVSRGYTQEEVARLKLLNPEHFKTKAV